MTFVVYIIGGMMGLFLSVYLFIYYFTHSKKVINGMTSCYFRRLSYLFLAFGYISAMWLFSGLLSTVGFRDSIIPHIPLLVSIGLIIICTVLIKFTIATNQE
jgi:hypothetical protein